MCETFTVVTLLVGGFTVVALLVGGFAGCSTLQSIAVCSNAAGEYENENENENEYLLIW